MGINKQSLSFGKKSKTSGEVVTKFRKAWDKNEDNCLDTLMTEWDKQPQDVQDSDGSDYTEETV